MISKDSDMEIIALNIEKLLIMVHNIVFKYVDVLYCNFPHNATIKLIFLRRYVVMQMDKYGRIKCHQKRGTI